MLFAYLSDSDSINVTSIYKMYPNGRHGGLRRAAHAARAAAKPRPT